MKTELSESLKTCYVTSNNFRNSLKEDNESLKRARDNLKNEIQKKADTEKLITEILNNKNANNFDFNTAIAAYKDAKNYLPHNFKLTEILFNLISLKKEEHIKNDLKKYTAKDKAAVNKILEDIETNKWKINEEVLKKLHDLIK